MSKYINGVCYGWADITAKIANLELVLQSIDYGDELEKEVAYGMGAAPAGYGKGNYKASCKLSMLKDDYDIFAEHIKKQGKTLYGFDIPKIVVSYANDGESIKTDIVNGVSITKVDNKGAVGDKTLSIDIECIVYGKIIRNGLEPIK